MTEKLFTGMLSENETKLIFYFLQKNAAVGGENKNKILQRHFNFHLDFQKNRVGSPENKKIEKILALETLLRPHCALNRTPSSQRDRHENAALV